MKAGSIVSIASVLALWTACAAAQMQPVQRREPRPGASALAATANVVFMPVRLAVTTVGAGLGGLTGWLTAGNHNAANDIWGLFDGQGFLQPDMMYGAESLQLGELQYQMHITKP